MDFVSFHSHDTNSHADALGTTEQHVKRVAELGMTALGTSNHGNVNNHVAMERWCKEYKIKPIYGCEVYFAPVGEKKTRQKTHLTIFAMNDEGYRNLNRIITQSWLDFYQWPTVSWESLVKHNAGLAVFSGCADSFISCTLLGGKFLGPKKEPEQRISNESFNSALRKIQRFSDVFEERFFLEVQRFPHFNRTCALNAVFSRMSNVTGIPLIATADVHYPYVHQKSLQATLHAGRWKSSPEFLTEQSWEHNTNLSYPESDEEIINDLQETGLFRETAQAAVWQSASLAANCNVELPKAKPLRFPGIDAMGHSKVSRKALTRRYMWEQIREGWTKRCDQRPELRDRAGDYNARLQKEMKVIVEKDFCDYFLAVADLVKWAKDNDITVGPGRGSAAASLVCYLLRITEIDPLHPLFNRTVFERFVDPTRSDMPDIDLDFDDELRGKVAQQARNIYGQENVCNVANHIGYKGKNSLNDVCRAYHLPLATFDPIKKRIQDRVETDERVDDSIKDVLESYKNLGEVAELVQTYPNQLQQAMELEGNQHSMGIHAGGYVISSEPIPEVCAIYTREKGTGRKKQLVQVIPYEKRDAEYLGMLKMDFLGSSTMGAIGGMRKYPKFSLDDLYVLIYKEYDKWVTAFKGNVFDTILQKFRDDDVVGIMQFEGGTTRAVTRAVAPTDFDELAACTALSRPGPYYGGQYSNYVAVKHGEKDWERIHEKGFDRHVEWTYGQIVYQEQIMWILRDLAGFDIPTVLRVRKIIGKKLGEHQFVDLWERFRNGCDTNGVGTDNAVRVWGAITTAAGYAFNVAHAYSYALIAWWQMWFKINYPLEFYATTLAKNGDGKLQIPRRTALLQDAQTHRIPVCEWDINKCEANWSIGLRPMLGLTGSIRPGFAQIPGIGEATAQDIVKWRYELPFAHYDKLTWDGLASSEKGDDGKKIGCYGIGEQTVEKIKAFISQTDPFGITRTKDQLEAFRQQLTKGDFDNTGLPDALDEYAMAGHLPSHSSTAFVGLIKNIAFRDEIESIRSKTGQSIEEIRNEISDPGKTKKATVFAYDENGEVALRVSRWQYPRLAAKLDAIKFDHHIIVAWGKTYETHANSIQVKALWILDPD